MTATTTSAAARYLARAALFALLFGTAACGTATTPTTPVGGQPQAPARIYPPTSVPEISPQARGHSSAGAAAHRARQVEHKLGQPSLP